MPAPVIIIIAPVLMAFIAFSLRRWPIACALFAVVSASALAVYISQVDTVLPGSRIFDQTFGNAWVIYGRSLFLGRSGQSTLLFAYGVLCLLFILTLVLPQSTIYIPLSLFVMAPIATVLIAQSIAFGSIILLVVAAILAVLVQGHRSGSTLDSVRLLSLTALAVPLLLTAGWMIGTGDLQYLPTTMLLLVAAILILLSAFPFQFWVSDTVSNSGSLVPALVFGIVNLLIVVFALRLLVTNPIIFGNAQFLRIISISGAATILLASLLALTTPSLGRILGYFLLLDIGATALALGVGGRAAFETVLAILVLRIFGLVVAGFGLGLIRRKFTISNGGDGQISYSRGQWKRAPLGTLLIIYGSLSLIGAPLTPGFIGRWQLIAAPSGVSSGLSALLVLSIAAGTIGLARIMVHRLTPESEFNGPATVDSTGAKIAAGLLIVAGIMITIVPSFILDLASSMVYLF